MPRFDCPHCGKTIRVNESAAGKKGKCPGCGETIQVPASSAPNDDDILAMLGDAPPPVVEGEPPEPESSEHHSPPPITSTAATNNTGLQDFLHYMDGRRLNQQAKYAGLWMVPVGFVGVFLGTAIESDPLAYVGGLLVVLGLAFYVIARIRSTATPQAATTAGNALVAVGCGGGCLLPIIGLVLLIAFAPSSDGPDEVEAGVMAKEFVTDSLRSPSTADFGWAPPEVVEVGDNTYKVSGHVDAQNAFGATIRNRWVCEVRYVGDGKWRCESLKLY